MKIFGIRMQKSVVRDDIRPARNTGSSDEREAETLDLRSRIEVERDVIGKRLMKLYDDRAKLREHIKAKTADLADLEKIIAGMELHQVTIAPDAEDYAEIELVGDLKLVDGAEGDADGKE